MEFILRIIRETCNRTSKTLVFIQLSLKSEDIETVKATPPLPIKPDGFIPNSILVRLLWPQKTLTEQKERQEEVYRPPKLTEEQMKQISTVKKVRIGHVKGY